MKRKANKQCSWEPFEIIRSTYLAQKFGFFFFTIRNIKKGVSKRPSHFLGEQH